MRQISGEGITSWQRCSLLMWDAIVARAEGKDGRMREMLQASLLAGQELGGEFMLMNWCGPWLPDLLGEALSADIESEHVVDLVRRFGIPSPSEHVEAWPWPVRVFTLGQFKVEVGGSTLEFPGKSPRKLFRASQGPLRTRRQRRARGTDHGSSVGRAGWRCGAPVVHHRAAPLAQASGDSRLHSALGWKGLNQCLEDVDRCGSVRRAQRRRRPA